MNCPYTKVILISTVHTSNTFWGKIINYPLLKYIKNTDRQTDRPTESYICPDKGHRYSLKMILVIFSAKTHLVSSKCNHLVEVVPICKLKDMVQKITKQIF